MKVKTERGKFWNVEELKVEKWETLPLYIEVTLEVSMSFHYVKDGRTAHVHIHRDVHVQLHGVTASVNPTTVY